MKDNRNVSDAASTFSLGTKSAWLARSTGRRLLDDIKQEIRERVHLPAVAEQLGVERRWSGWRCPFHEDSNPSLSIRAKSFKCFACGAQGDAIGFVRELLSLGFRDPLAYLAEPLGIVMPWPTAGRRLCHQ